MIVRISTLSESCGLCRRRIQKDELVALLTTANKKRCVECAGISKADQERYYSEIVIQGEREHDCTPKKTFSFRKAAIMAMDTLPVEVRERNVRALMERDE
jgi:hypothetical protein